MQTSRKREDDGGDQHAGEFVAGKQPGRQGEQDQAERGGQAGRENDAPVAEAVDCTAEQDIRTDLGCEIDPDQDAQLADCSIKALRGMNRIDVRLVTTACTKCRQNRDGVRR